jgi:class 3 adenylate cyclase
VPCAACGEPLAPDARFCSQCGVPSPNRPVGTDAEGQRRWLTVMFCDVAGSTAISRRVDPEVHGACMLAYQGLGREIVERHGGRVANYTGDGILAFFGWPTAIERDADMALLAAHDLLGRVDTLNDALERSYGVRLPIRIGIHSGLALVGRMGGDGRHDTSVFGDTANIAARIQDVTHEGTVAISAETSRVLRDRWVLESLGWPDLKGVGTAVEVLRAISPGAVPGPDVERVYRLVDREPALRELRSAWAAASEGRGLVLALEGEAGVGKSRIAYELQQVIGPAISWRTVQCSPLAGEQPFGPFASVAPVGGDGGGSSPEERRAARLQSMLRWCRGLADTGPSVLHIEDAHWADPSTGELVERLAEDLRDHPVPLLVLCTARPSAAPWTEHPGVRRLPLPPLDDDDMHELVRSAAGSSLPSSVVGDVVHRADGLPLYAEQLAAAMVDSPGSVVPVTLQGVLMARLDQLGPDLMALLQAASAIGRTFEDGLLRRLVDGDVDLDRSLARLVDADILVLVPGGRHKFRHALLQEAAHESMLHRRRREVHRRVAALMMEDPASVESQPSVVGHHLAEAHEPEAVRWFERAGTRAASAAAFREATIHFTRALGAGGPLEAAVELRLRISLGNAMFGAVGYSAADSLPVWTRAQELARQLDDPDELTSALNGEATYWNQAGSCRRSVAVAEEILRVADARDLRIGRLRGHCTLALNALFLGESAGALGHAQQAIALYRPEDFHTVTYGFGTDQGVIAHCVAGAAAWFTGRPDEGIEQASSAVQLGHELGSPISELVARVFKGLIHHLRQEHASARDEAVVLTTEGSRLLLPFPLGFGHILLGAEQAAMAGDPAGVVGIVEGMNELAGAGGQGGAPIAFVLLAEAQLATGDPAAAARTARDGRAMADGLDQPFLDAELLRLEAVCRRALDGPTDEVRELLRTAVDRASSQGAPSLALRAACDLAEMAPEAAPGVLGALLEHIEGGRDTADVRRARELVDAHD